MKKKEIILVIGAIVFAVATTVGVLAFTKDSAITKSSTNLSKDHSDGHSEHSGAEETSKESLIDLTNQSEVTMDITEFKYAKANIKIKKGTKVTWVNQDTVEHNVMGSHEGEEKAHDAVNDNEVSEGKLASPLLKKGESYSFTFEETGTVIYHCSPHPYMKGTVTVI